MMATPEQMMAVAAQAANAASQAATALQEYAKAAASEPPKQKFNEVSKVVRCPERFGSENADVDQKQWRDFLLAFKAWLFYADNAFEAEVSYLEKNSKTAVTLDSMNAGQKSRTNQLYSILTGLLKGKPLRVLRQVEGRNGMEVLRQLIDLYTPSSRARSIALLQSFMQFPSFTKEKTMHEQILALERLRSEYQSCSGKDISDDLALSVLVRALPAHIRQHVQLQMSETTTYSETRTRILG